jgi:hypothetical protein
LGVRILHVVVGVGVTYLFVAWRSPDLRWRWSRSRRMCVASLIAVVGWWLSFAVAYLVHRT